MRIYHRQQITFSQTFSNLRLNSILDCSGISSGVRPVILLNPPSKIYLITSYASQPTEVVKNLEVVIGLYPGKELCRNNGEGNLVVKYYWASSTKNLTTSRSVKYNKLIKENWFSFKIATPLNKLIFPDTESKATCGEVRLHVITEYKNEIGNKYTHTVTSEAINIIAVLSPITRIMKRFKLMRESRWVKTFFNLVVLCFVLERFRVNMREGEVNLLGKGLGKN